MSQTSQPETELARKQKTQSTALVPKSESNVQIQSQIPNNEPNSTLYILKPVSAAKSDTHQKRRQPPQGQSRPRTYDDPTSYSLYVPNQNNRQNQQKQQNQQNRQTRPRLNQVNPQNKRQPTALTTVQPVRKPVQANNTGVKNAGDKINKKANPVKRAANKFKRSGLGTIDSHFNAYFIYYEWKSSKQRRYTKSYLKTIAKHPRGWTKRKDNNAVYESNIYDRYLALLTFIAKLWGFICGLFNPAYKFFQSVGEFISTSGKSSKAAKNIGIASGKSLNFLAPAAAVVFTVMIMLNIGSFQPELELTVNGKNMGFVDSKSTAGKVVSIIENNVSSVLNEPYEFDVDLSYRIVLTKERSYVSENELYDVMYNSPQVQDAITTAYGLYIDGELVVAVENESDINAVLNEVLEANLDGENDGTIEFVNDIQIIESKYAKKNVVTQVELKSIISNSADSTEAVNQETDGAESEVLHEITDSAIPLYNGAGFSAEETTNTESEDIAAMAAASSLELTPEAINAIPRGFSGYLADSEEISLQDDIISKLTKPAGNMAAGAIQFKKTKTETYSVDVPFEVEYRDSEQYYVGTQTVRTNGKNGENLVTAEVTYIGDNEVEREIKSTEVIREPVTKIVVVGTKPKPLAGPTGGFIRPIKGGYTTSRFSGGHRGLDLVVPSGSPIYASDGGTIIYAGYSGSYGNHVKIKHSDGFVSLYAHMSSISVSYGEKVFQGQEIGKVGSTGNSTGPHLHFEIMKNGVLVNPESYLN